MHLVFVLPIGEYYNREWSGAIATITRYLARELTKVGHRITVLTPDDGRAPYREGEVVRLRHGPAHPHPALVRRASALVARLRGWTSPDYGSYWHSVAGALHRMEDPPNVVVVANDPRTAGRLARSGGHRQTVLWLHNRLEGQEAMPFQGLPRTVRVVAVSEAVAHWTGTRYLPDHEIAVIYSGVDHDQFHPRSGWLEVRDPVRIVCHGRIDPNKGHEVAAAAVTMLRARGLPVELTVIGEVRTFGFSEADQDRYSRRLDLAIVEAGGRRLGWMPHATLAEELRRHDIACVLSRVDEPFGLVNLEAMASGCAIIATRKGGIPEAVGDGGILVDPESPDQVASVIADWVADRPLLNTMKGAALTQARRFSWAASSSALLEMLRAATAATEG